MTQQAGTPTDQTASLQIAPSLLSADFGRLAEEAQRAEKAGADMLHLDVMDGHFVPNLTFGHQVVAAVNRSTELFLDVHLMVYQPFDYIERMVQSGADRITFHLEATEDVEETLQFIRTCGAEAGLAVCPDTSENLLIKYLDKIDLLLLMTVQPGFGGQEFMPEVLEKVRFIRQTCDKLGLRKGGKTDKNLPPFAIQVDGGINAETAAESAAAGANILVAGSYLFGSDSLEEAINTLRGK